LIKNCVICGKRYKLRGSSQKTCGKVCSYELQKQNAARYRNKNREPLVPRQCPMCTGFFQPTRRDHRFCSKTCQNRKRDRLEAKPPKNCVECGKEFIPRNCNAKLCSTECRYVWEKRREVIRGRINYMPFSIPEKKCALCNATFKPKTGAHKYCSASCNQDAAKHRSWEYIQKSPIRPKTCMHCNMQFKPRTRKSMAKFCSALCRAGYQTAKRQQKIDELEREHKSLEKLQKKWDDSSIQVKDCPPDTAFAREIWHYLKKGKTITKYLHPIWAAGSVIDEDETELFEL
jgi:hypothetical protein